MTLRIRSLSHEDLLRLEAAEQLDSLTPECSSHHALKKVKTLSQDILKPPAKKDFSASLMNDLNLSITQIRYIPIKKWIQAMEHDPNNGVLVFNYARIRPFLIKDRLKQIPEEEIENYEKRYRHFDNTVIFPELSDPIEIEESSYSYLSMTQKELFAKAQQLSFEGACIYKNLAQAYTPLNYMGIGEFHHSAGGAWPVPSLIAEEKKFSTTHVMKNCLKLIELYPEDDKYYVLLGKTIRYNSIIQETFFGGKEGKVLLPSGIKTEEELYLKALELNPLNDEAYVGLGLLQDRQDQVYFCSSKSSTTNPKPYIKALHLNPHNLEAALLLSDLEENICFPDGHTLSISQVIKNAASYTPHYLAMLPYWRLVMNLNKTTQDKECLSILLKKFIESSAERHLKRNTLICLMRSIEHTYGEEWDGHKILTLLPLLTKTHLVDVKEDLKLLYRYDEVFLNRESISLRLGSIGAELLKAHMFDNQELLKNYRQFFIRVIEERHDDDFIAYYHLATLLSPDESISIKKQLYTKEQLYFCAAEKVPKSTLQDPYDLHLAAKILSHCSYVLGNEEEEEYVIDGEDDKDNLTHVTPFYSMALSINPSSSWPYVYMGKQFSDPLQIQGKWFHSPRELFLKALDLDPYNAEAYYHLANTLLEEHVTLLSGTQFTPRELYTRSIQLGIQEADAYLQASKLIQEKDAILLLDGVTYLSKIDLLFRAFILNPSSSYYLKQIALNLKKRAFFTLQKGL